MSDDDDDDLDLDALSDDDEWVDSNHCQSSNTYINRQAKKPPTPANDLERELQYGRNDAGKKVVEYLEKSDLPFKDLVWLCTEILISKPTGLLVWIYFKPYHLKCLAYQVASAIQSKSITTPNLVDMVFKCYKMIIKSSQKRAVVPGVHKNKSLYIQWVANAGELMITNLALIYYFLKDCELESTVPPFCKLN